MSTMIFIYGFGPYDEFKGNISATVIANLPEAVGVSSQVFPSVFDRAIFDKSLNEFQPKYILGLGQTRRGCKLRIERYAHNVWAKRKGTPNSIVADASYHRRRMRWTLPLDESCEIGEDAGTYVCNFSMWVCDEWAEINSAVSAFLHIPVSFDVKTAVQYVESVILTQKQRA